MTYTTYIFLLNILISITLVNTSPCDIIENMLCLCHSSLSSDSEQLICNNNAGESINSTIKLKAEVRENVRSFDSFHLTFNDQNISINGMFINELSYLFPRLLTNEGKAKSKISITLSFPNFLQLNFEDYAFYQLFGEKHHIKQV